MTFEIGLAFILLIGALILFALDRYPVDFVAFAILTLVLILGPILHIKPAETISGFSNPATITVLAMFILSAGIERTGLINLLTSYLTRFGGGEMGQLVMIMVVIGPISAFINNTAAVAIMIPVVITLARERHLRPSKLLMPLSFFSQLAGVMTLIGTSTNILASELAVSHGYAPFRMFEFATIGFLIFVSGGLYLVLVGRKLLPERRTQTEVTENYHISSYLSEVLVQRGSRLVGKPLLESGLRDRFDIQVLEILRAGRKLAHPLAQYSLQPDDLLLIKANRQQLLKIKDIEGLMIATDDHFNHPTLKSQQMGLLEVIIGPNSDLIGSLLEDVNFRHRYGCTVIAMQKHGEIIQERLGHIPFNFGDTLLLRGPKAALTQIKQESGFIVTEEMDMEAYRTEKAALALAIVAGVVVIAALGQPILVTALAGCTLMVLTGCLKMNELHEAIRWDVIFLLAGVIPLGLVLERSGGAQLLAGLAAQTADFIPPLLILTIFYATTTILTSIISNNAAVVVMVPVAIAAAETLELDAKAFILAIMFAASTSFMTPVGYQTNTMVYGPGGYKFLDFLRVGGPLNLLLAILTPIYIFLLWGI